MTSLGKPIALGRTAEIYAWEEGQVLKLFQNWLSADRVEFEAQISRAVHTSGLPVPAVEEVVEVNGRLGLIFERVVGPSMSEHIETKPWMFLREARVLAGLHADMHACNILPELPSQRQRLEDKIRSAVVLPPDLQQAGLRSLDHMPDGDRLCHGDFHPANILMTARGPIIIDWVDATRGNPVADVARTWVILSELGYSIPRLIKVLRSWFLKAYLKHYFQLHPNDQQQFTAWIPIVAAARLSENISEIQEWLLAQAKAGLS
jgi:uncharacterized protein (TIGR02172 family)